MLKEYLILSFGLNSANMVFKYCILGLVAGNEEITVVVGSKCIQCCKLGKRFMVKDGEMLEIMGREVLGSLMFEAFDVS